MTSTKEPALAGHGGDSFTPVRRKGSVTRRTDVIVTALLLAVWLAVVIFTTTRHEYWRDEVRAWSLARAAIGLALLANTNIHVTILAFLLMVVWAWDELSARGSAPDWRRGGPLLLAAGIVALGVLLSVVVVSPPRDTVLTGFYSTTPKAFASAFTAAVLQPRAGFRNLFPSFVPWAVGHAILYLVILGLLRRPILSLAALGGLIALGGSFAWDPPGVTGTRASSCASCCACTGWPPMSPTAEPDQSWACG